MNVNKITFDRLKDIPEGAIYFIKFFMRMEFALKDNSFLKQRKVAEVDWDTFAEKLTNKFFDHIYKSGLAITLISRPPSKQINRNDSLDWSSAKKPLVNTKDLFIAIRRLRNNLFHGGKSGDKDSDRNNELIADAIKVMIEALKWSEEVRYSFEGQY